MKKDTTTKKVWQKPEVSDLDVNSTSASKSIQASEVGSLYGPAAS